MIAFDTNILFPVVVSDHPDRAAVGDFIQGLDGRDDVALSEFALVELYGLLRQPAVMRRVLDARAAADVCTALRKHPRWRLLGFPGDTAARRDPGSPDAASTTHDLPCAWWPMGCGSSRP